MLPPGSPRRIAAVGALAAGLVGFATNDSGVIVTALVLVYLGPFLTLLALEVERGGPVLSDPAVAEPLPRPPVPPRVPEPAPVRG
jgi:hypothetical protein